MLLSEAKEILEREGFEVVLEEVEKDGRKREALKVLGGGLKPHVICRHAGGDEARRAG